MLWPLTHEDALRMTKEREALRAEIARLRSFLKPAAPPEETHEEKRRRLITLSHGSNEREADHIDIDDLEAAAEIYDQLVDGTHYQRQEQAMQEMYGHGAKYIEDPTKRALYCHDCGELMQVLRNGVTQHRTGDRELDRNLDAQHVALDPTQVPNLTPRVRPGTTT
jgi:hypothetical protein